MSERRHAAKHCIILELSFALSTYHSVFIKYKSENLNARSLLLFSSSLRNSFYSSRLILPSSEVLHRLEVLLAFRWFQCRIRVMPLPPVSFTCIRSSKSDLIRFLSGMCTDSVTSKIYCAVPIVNWLCIAWKQHWPPEQTLLESLWLVWMEWSFGLLIRPVISCQNVPGLKVIITTR